MKNNTKINNIEEVELQYPDGDIRNNIPSQVLVSFDSSDFTERPPIMDTCDTGTLDFITRIKQNEDTREELSIYYSSSLNKTLLVPYTQGITLYTISVMNMNFSLKLGAMEPIVRTELEGIRNQIEEDLNIDPLIERLLKVDLLPYAWVFLIVMVELNYTAEELNKLIDELEQLSNHSEVVAYISDYTGYKYCYMDIATLYRYLSGDKDYHNSIEKMYLDIHPDFNVNNLSPVLVNKDDEDNKEEKDEEQKIEKEEGEEMKVNTAALPKGASETGIIKEEITTELEKTSPTKTLFNRANIIQQPNVEVSIPNSNVKVTVGETSTELTPEEKAIKEQIETMATDMVTDIKNITTSSSSGSSSLGVSTSTKVGLGLLGLGVVGAVAYYFKDDWSKILGDKEFSDVGY